jgi:Ca-activated chloride channel family protein
MQLPITFLIPALLLLSLVAAPLLVWLRRKRHTALGHSHVGLHKNVRTTPLAARLPAILFGLLVVAMLAALARPVLPFSQETRTIESRDICIEVDISGSMGVALPNQQTPPQPTTTSPTGTGGTTGQPTTYRRLDAARDAVSTFITMRPATDRIAIGEFDDEAYWLAPLTDNRRILLRKAALLNSYVGGGTNFEGPTDSNPRVGPIQAAIKHFQKYGKAKSKILILVTDGENSISDLRFQQFQQQLQAMGIKLYVLGVGEGWGNGRTPDLQRLAESIGGQVFPVADANAMQAAFDTINQTEVSTVHLDHLVAFRELYALFAAFALATLVLYLGISVVTREVA